MRRRISENYRTKMTIERQRDRKRERERGGGERGDFSKPLSSYSAALWVFIMMLINLDRLIKVLLCFELRREIDLNTLGLEW